MRQEQEHTEAADNAGLTNREPENTFHRVMVAIEHSLRDIASSDIGDDGEGDDYDWAREGPHSEHDEPCFVMGTITKTI
jgi:hypothetical protein